MAKKSKKGQLKILNEIKNQLVLQAERWGKTDYYTPLKFEELELEQARKIKGELLMEKSNLEYEMNSLGTDKKEVLIKIERLETYVRKADHMIESYERKIAKMIENNIGNMKDIKKAEGTIKTKPRISVMINS